MPVLSIIARAEKSRARAGVLSTSHGPVHTPAFVPLATKGSVRGLSAAEVAGLGYQMVLGNTFHLFLSPGEELIAELGGLHEFMGWRAPIITDSGGFQVFSLGHGTVADEIKGRRRGAGPGAILSIDEDGVRFRSQIDGAQRFMGPETSMAVQRALGSDIVLAFDECTPFHVDREYTQHSTERTHRWLERCLRWRAASPDSSIFYGIVQGGVHEDLRVASTQTVLASGCDGVAIGGSLGAEKQQMYEVVDWSCAELARGAGASLPRHLLGIGEIDDLIHGVELGIDTFDCAMPTRLARHGTALVPVPEERWRLALDRPAMKRDRRPVMEDCPCPACAAGHSRAYLHQLARARELTGARLLTLHNLTFIAAVMRRLRAGIEAGDFARVADALRAGASPY